MTAPPNTPQLKREPLGGAYYSGGPMKASFLSITGITVLGVAFVALLTTGSAVGGRAGSQTAADQCAARLATFDALDFDIFSNQKWPRVSESHASDIVVTWPDGHE